MINAGFASCTGLSIFLVDALRAVGVPARVAGAPPLPRKLAGRPRPRPAALTRQGRCCREPWPPPDEPSCRCGSSSWPAPGGGANSVTCLLGSAYNRPPQSSVQQTHATVSNQLSVGMTSASAMPVSALGGTVSRSVVAPVWGDNATTLRRAMLCARRAAGTPRWNTPAGGNHDWVEFWDAGAWSFLGAAEPAPPNVTWWAGPWSASIAAACCQRVSCNPKS